MSSRASKEWLEVRLEEFVSLQRGHDLPEPQRRPGPVPIIGSFGTTGWHDVARSTGPGITIGRSGASFGTVSYSAVDFWPLNTALYVTNFHGNDPQFAFYLLKSIDFRPHNSGSAQPSLNRNFIGPIPLRIPHPREQRAIARILGALDDKIELNRRTNETLEAMARAIFQSWFVDFDPVRAKMEGRHPEGMDAETAKLFPGRFATNASVPANWHFSQLGELASYLSRGVGPAYQESGGVLVLNQKCIRGRQVDVALARRHDSLKRRIDDRLLQAGDVLVNSTGVGTLGRAAQLHVLDEPTIVDSHITVVRASPAVDSSYLGSALLWDESVFENMGHGSTGQTELPRTALAAHQVLVPPLQIQRAFADAIRPATLHGVSARKESGALATLRDTLLPKLLSGELRVPDAERAVANAL